MERLPATSQRETISVSRLRYSSATISPQCSSEISSLATAKAEVTPFERQYANKAGADICDSGVME